MDILLTWCLFASTAVFIFFIPYILILLFKEGK